MGTSLKNAIKHISIISMANETKRAEVTHLNLQPVPAMAFTSDLIQCAECHFASLSGVFFLYTYKGFAYALSPT
jgi:hypothetical protein